MIISIPMLIQTIYSNTYLYWQPTYLAHHRINLHISTLHSAGLLGKLLSQQPFVIYGMLSSYSYDFMTFEKADELREKVVRKSMGTSHT